MYTHIYTHIYVGGVNVWCCVGVVLCRCGAGFEILAVISHTHRPLSFPLPSHFLSPLISYALSFPLPSHFPHTGAGDQEVGEDVVKSVNLYGSWQAGMSPAARPGLQQVCAVCALC